MPSTNPPTRKNTLGRHRLSHLNPLPYHLPPNLKSGVLYIVNYIWMNGFEGRGPGVVRGVLFDCPGWVEIGMVGEVGGGEDAWSVGESCSVGESWSAGKFLLFVRECVVML